MEKFSLMCYPAEIAEKLYNLMADGDKDEMTKEHQMNELEDALYSLLAIAQNNYNSDYWRTFYKVLESITPA